MLVVLATACLVSCAQGLTYDRGLHQYQDLLVAVAPDLEAAAWPGVKAGLEAWLRGGSRALHTATQGWAHIATVKVLLPAAWDESVETTVTGTEVFEDAEVRVSQPHPLHGDAPFTEQPGRCGEQGSFLQVSEGYLTSSPAPLAFLHSWARLRYGVYEEYGYPGDPRYPAFHRHQTWTSEGAMVRVEPALCTNVRVEGTMVDDRGGECSYDKSTGLPDAHCRFTATGPADLVSSVMAVPYLQSSEHFCKQSEEHLHNPLLPNRHNDLCDGQSVWEVILKHGDFDGWEPQPGGDGEFGPTTNFTYIKPRATQRYVTVLDISGSMGPVTSGCPRPTCADPSRLSRTKKAATSFLRYAVEDGTPLGAVSFSTDAATFVPVVQVNASNRESTINAINDLEVNGGTCLGKGLLEGLAALNRYDNEDGSGVIIFLTDGKYSCNGNDWPNFQNDLNAIKAQNVRVITIAFSNNADPKIETISKETNGASYFVTDDSGPGALNDAFSGALNFQPRKKTEDMKATLLQKTYKGQTAISANFSIDAFSGRDVVVQLDVDASNSIIITIDNITTTWNPSAQVHQQSWPSLAAGAHSISISSGAAMAAVTLVVESKAPSGVLPVLVETWTSLGEDELDLTLPSVPRLALLAKVEQGGRPVSGAAVTVLVDRDNGGLPVEVALQDDGLGADLVAGDGLYAKYFIKFLANMGQKRYSFSCLVEGEEGTTVNHGHNLTQGREVVEEAPCCGSSAVGEDSDLRPTGGFTRAQAGGVISVGPTNGINLTSLYPPGRVVDLTLGSMDFTTSTFLLTFTWPGGQLDQGTVEGYQVFYTGNQSLVSGGDLEAGGDLLTVGDLQGNLTTLPPPQSAGTREQMEVKMAPFPTDRQLYWRVKVASAGKSSLSNTATLYLVEVGAAREEAALTWGEAIGIFLGAFGVTLVLLGAAAWYWGRHGGT